jgi:2-(3-amino-3-carboxypropyl)histidine synthase
MLLSNKFLFLLRLRYIALGLIPAGWWEKTQMQKHGCEDVTGCNKSNCCGDAKGTNDFGGDYPIDYYAQDEGDWNSSYVKKSSRPARQISVTCVANSVISFLVVIDLPCFAPNSRVIS